MFVFALLHFCHVSYHGKFSPSELMLLMTVWVLSSMSSLCVMGARSCPTLCDPQDCSPPAPSVHGILQTRILEWVAISFSGDLPDPGIEPVSPALQVDSLPLAPPRKTLPYDSVPQMVLTCSPCSSLLGGNCVLASNFPSA